MPYLRKPDFSKHPQLIGTIPHFYVVLSRPEDFVAAKGLTLTSFIVSRGPVLCIPEQDEEKARKRLQRLNREANQIRHRPVFFSPSENEFPVVLDSQYEILAAIELESFRNLGITSDGKLCCICGSELFAVRTRGRIEGILERKKMQVKGIYKEIPYDLFTQFGSESTSD